MNWKTTVLICLVILALAAGAIGAIYSTEPKVQRSDASKRTAMLVDVTAVERGTFRPEIVAMGTVRPELEIELSPRVSGEIISISDSFTPGGYVEKGELLLQIDPADFEATLQQRQSELLQASAELELELGRQDLAKRDYQALQGTISSEYKALVLREPQLNTARAAVEAARVAVQRAELDLERTRIRAPFAAHILSREANVGSQVAPGAELGRLVGIERYWVEVTVPVASLRWMVIPENGAAEGSAARIRNRAAWPQGVYRDGRVHNLIGALENQTRLARVLLSVADPLAHEPASAGRPQLMIGSYVEARIEGKPVEDVIRMKRDYLRQRDTVWVMEEDVLRIREADVVFRDEEYVYIGSGLDENDRVVTTNLATVIEGAPLRLEGATE